MAFSQSALKGSIKLFPKNGKLFAFIAISSVVLNSCLFLLFSFSIQSIIKHISAAITQPGLLNENIALLLADEFTYMLTSFIIAFFVIMATIIVSAISYIGNTMTLKELFSEINETWKRTLVTMLYSSGLTMGYSLCLVLILIPLIMYPSPIAKLVAVIFGLPGLLLSLYLSISWTLAIVVSVVEENCYGADALARASRLAKGKRLQGFMINLGFNIVNLIVISLRSYWMTIGGNSVVSQTVYGVITVSMASLLNILLMVAYTVFYYQCKKHHGEEIEELHGSVHYTKLQTGILTTDCV